MKIEMGESLFYSWLRHVKKCQLVQTNWKPSPKWILKEENKLQAIMNDIRGFYEKNYGYNIFNKNSLYQLLRQAECDVFGIRIQEDGCTYFAVDVAFHRGGLDYKNNVVNVLKKCARAALTLDGYFHAQNAEIIFATPKSSTSDLKKIEEVLEGLNQIYKKYKCQYKFRIIANDTYNENVLNPILAIADGIADTSELFLRSYQMYRMFNSSSKKIKENDFPNHDGINDDWSELKIGQIARFVLAPLLAKGSASGSEIKLLQTQEYSKRLFDIQYPLLKRVESEQHPSHYYSDPISIKGVHYFLCSEWFERPENNDRPYLIKWINSHRKGN